MTAIYFKAVMGEVVKVTGMSMECYTGLLPPFIADMKSSKYGSNTDHSLVLI